MNAEEQKSMRPSISVTGLSKTYDPSDEATKAVDDVSFTVATGEFYTLLGPSGCGKTTTLRCVAGLEDPDAGRVEIDGEVVADVRTSKLVPPHRRDVGMVFQSYAVWPHMTVFENVAFPVQLERPRPKRDAVRERVRSALEAVRLYPFEKRMATQLSGGQQQRLALARALVRRPSVLLLDEPLSNLDAKLRDDMRTEILRLKAEYDLTVLYVTHDQTEALAMSTRIAVMDRGRTVQVGTPSEIYEEPATRFVAEFIGRTNFINGKIVDADAEWCRIQTSIGQVTVPKERLPTGGEITLAIRPESIEMLQDPVRHDVQETNAFPAVVRSQNYFGNSTEVRVELNDGSQLKALTPPNSGLALGQEILVFFRPEDCMAIPPESDSTAADPQAEPVR